jgi:hypothetical protein
MWKKLLQEQDGSALPIMAFVLTISLMISALVVDIGRLYYENLIVEDKSEAVALAAVQEVFKGSEEAKRVGREYAAMNDLVNPDIQVDMAQKTVTVQADKQVPYYFAPIFGIDRGAAKGNAKAKIGKTVGGNGFLPIGVESQSFQFNRDYILKYGAQGSQQGNFGALALGGTGASIYRNNLKYGYGGWLKIGMKVDTEPGNMTGPTSQGMSDRYDQDKYQPHCQSIDTADKSCSRVLFIPIIDSLDVNGGKQVEIVNFAAFFIKELNGHEIWGQFVRMVHPGEMSEVEDSDEFGLHSSKLVE